MEAQTTNERPTKLVFGIGGRCELQIKDLKKPPRAPRCCAGDSGSSTAFKAFVSFGDGTHYGHACQTSAIGRFR